MKNLTKNFVFVVTILIVTVLAAIATVYLIYYENNVNAKAVTQEICNNIKALQAQNLTITYMPHSNKADVDGIVKLEGGKGDTTVYITTFDKRHKYAVIVNQGLAYTEGDGE